MDVVAQSKPSTQQAKSEYHSSPDPPRSSESNKPIQISGMKCPESALAQPTVGIGFPSRGVLPCVFSCRVMECGADVVDLGG